MSFSMFDKSDYKGVTALSVLTMVESLSESDDPNKKDKIIFMTSFGIIQAEEVLKRDYDFNSDSDEDKIFPDYLLQIALNSRDEMLKEHNNEKLLLQQTSFILKNVKIKPFNSEVFTNLPIMILFSEDIIGITLGQVN